jgi:hypothetical protein
MEEEEEEGEQEEEEDEDEDNEGDDDDDDDYCRHRLVLYGNVPESFHKKTSLR